MGFFGRKDDTLKKNEGGFMDAIRCDQTDYLIWKWRPAGQDVGTTVRENAIRYGSSLNVKDGEVAAFVYHQKDGTMQDFIVGPYNDTIKTANFPVLAKIVGLAFGGASPFQAEVYYINMAGLIQLPFAVPYFDMFDPRLPDFPISMAVRGSFAFGITDYKQFVKLHRLSNFELEDFKKQIKDNLVKFVKGVVTNIPDGTYGGAPIPIVQMERRLLQINELVQQYIQPKLSDVYGVTLKDFNIAELDVDKTCEGYVKVKELTANYTEASLKTQQNINLSNAQETNRLQMDAMKQNQAIQMENMQESLRINREEGQFAQRQATEANAYTAKLQAEQQNLGAFAIKNQTQVGIAAADAMGKQGASGVGNVNLGGAGGMNPGAMMANMAMGTAVGAGMANMLSNSFAGAATGMGAGIMPGMAAPAVPPPPVEKMYNVAVNGTAAGPYSVQQLHQMAMSGQFNAQSLVWTAGMANWMAAGQVAELQSLFVNTTVPPIPPAL
ncbi:SPFH domain-containing protein [Treponema vincentii]|uniref:SPFH domain-containing protein n=1 Tax=Treponema vincentii TaxID=69710 RepID=UPI0035F53931